MKTTILFTVLFSFQLAWGQSMSERQLADGLLEEEVHVNFDRAIDRYRAILERFEKEQQVAATAMFRLAECYRKLGKTTEASIQYRSVIQRFDDQTDLVRHSQDQLKALGQPIPDTGVELQSLTDEEQLALTKVQRLVEESPDLLNAEGPDGKTLLHQAVERNQLAVASYLLDKQASPNQMSQVAASAKFLPTREMPLHAAARLGHLSMAKLLLERGAEVDAGSSRETTPLHYAVFFERLEVAKLLLDGGAEVERSTGKVLLSQPKRGARLADDVLEGDREWTLDPFQLALSLNRSEVWLTLLLNHGGFVNKAYEESTFPIHLAVESDWLDQVTFLMAHGADINMADSAGRRPIHQVVSVSVLAKLQEGALDLQANDQSGDNALHHAARRGDVDLCRNFIEAGLEADAKGAHDLTVLSIAIIEGHEALVEDLIESSQVDLELKADGLTPLMWAAKERADRSLQLLLKSDRKEFTEDGWRMLVAGVEVNARNDRGWTALHFAASISHLPGVTTLVTQGADVFAQTNERQCPFDLASNSDCIEYLGNLMNLRRKRERDAAIWYKDSNRRDCYRPALWKTPLVGGPVMLSDVMVASKMPIQNTTVAERDEPIAWGTEIDWADSPFPRDLASWQAGTRKQVHVRFDNRQKAFTVVAPLVEPSLYALSDSPVVASRLSELLSRAHLDGDLTEVMLTRASVGDQNGETLDFDLKSVTPETDIWLREGDVIDIPTRPLDGKDISVSRRADFFAATVWDQEDVDLRRSLDGDPGAYIAPSIIDAIVAVYQQEDFVLPNPDWGRVQILRGDTPIEVDIEAWFTDPTTNVLPPLQWGDRLEIPELMDGNHMGFSEEQRTALYDFLQRKITINGRDITLAPAFYQFIKDSKWSREKLPVSSSEDTAESFWLPTVLAQLGFSPEGFDLKNINLNGELGVDGTTLKWLLEGDRIQISSLNH